jgi:PD-(D/E)XK nuclease superfamily
MSKASLYINPKGYGVSYHSYSGSQDFNHCARMYYLKRVIGWRDRGEFAAMEFGSVVEHAIVEYHRAGIDAAIQVFRTGWAPFKEKNLEYSKKHISWDNLNRVGVDFVRLYALRYPDFPFTIKNSGRMDAEEVKNHFQVNHLHEVFPNTDLAGIQLTSYLDFLVQLENGQFDPMLKDDRGILDMKVSGSRCPTLVALDPQLRTYSWVTGIPTVGFLWFEVTVSAVGAGDEVTILDPVKDFKAGQKAYVLAEDFNAIPLVPASVYLVHNLDIYTNFKKIPNSKKDDKAARLEYIKKHGKPVPLTAFTTQSIEVRTATITEESRADIKRQIEQDVVRIVHANEQDFWPMQSGIRWPNDKCVNCSMRGICLGNNEMRDQLVELKSDPIF